MPNNKANMEFFGDIELVKKLESLQANVPQVIAEAMNRSAKIPADEMLSFIKKHKYSGVTESSFEMTEPQIKKTAKGTQVVMELGFKVSKGGIGAIFLNLGGMHNPPYFFIKNAVDNNVDKIAKAQNDAIRNAIKELS